MKLAAVINGGGRPGRYWMDYRDSIREETKFERICDRLDVTRPSAGLLDYIFTLSAPARIVEIGPHAHRAARAWRERFPRALVLTGSEEPEPLPPTEYFVYRDDPPSIKWMWRRIVKDYEADSGFNLILDSSAGGSVDVAMESWSHLAAGGLYVVEQANVRRWQEAVRMVPALRGVIYVDDSSSVVILENPST